MTVQLADASFFDAFRQPLTERTLMRITSREYKVMLKAALFRERKEEVARFMEEVSQVAARHEIKLYGKLATSRDQTVCFLDTPDFTLRKNGVVLRKRQIIDTGEFQFTLKFRSKDRYVAQGLDLSSDKRFKSKPKFEEDIAAVFRSRFSQSSTITLRDSELPFDGQHPRSIDDASSLFPFLSALRHDDRTLSLKTNLKIVNGLTAYERVYSGWQIRLSNKKASVAVILWTTGRKGRPLVAEFSFRYKDKHEEYSAKLAMTARNFFSAIQYLDSCAPTFNTKTRFAYGEFCKDK